jgi:hypothetical protein
MSYHRQRATRKREIVSLEHRSAEKKTVAHPLSAGVQYLTRGAIS